METPLSRGNKILVVPNLEPTQRFERRSLPALCCGYHLCSVLLFLYCEHEYGTSLQPNGAFLQIGIGLAIGIPAAIGAGRLMTTQLFGIKPWDPVKLALAVLMLGLAAVQASAIPARRAAGVEPMVA